MKPGYWKGRKRPELTKRNLENNPMKRIEVREKNKIKQIDNFVNGKTKCWSKGLTKESDSRLNKLSESLKERIFSEEHKQKIKDNHWSKKDLIQKNKILKDIQEHRKGEIINPKISESVKSNWKNCSSVFNSVEYRKKISDNTKLEKNPMWKGGKSYELYGLEFNKSFKNKIRKRDNQVCMNCGVHRERLNRSLDCHHINYDKGCNIMQNLVSLCKKCHSMTNTNREYWRRLFQEKLNKYYNYKYAENGDIILEVTNE